VIDGVEVEVERVGGRAVASLLVRPVAATTGSGAEW
jgi:hypothetical protein